jgi:peptidoglycan/xylan/chitin deacetylase (PgdA/CDA1 family)
MKTLLLKFVDKLHLYPLFNRYTRNTATIFMLHGIDADDDHHEGGISPGLLRRYFDYLKKHRYRVVSLASYIKALLNHEDTYKAVIFSVDDGYRDFYLNAFPVFREYGYPATIFITSDFIEKKLFFWWDTIEYAINSTTAKEIDLRFMGRGKVPLNDARQRAEMIGAVTRHCKTLTNKEKLNLVRGLVAQLEVDISDQPSGKYEPLSWDEIKIMQQHGIDFHPHTKTHPIISSVPVAEQREEVTISKRVIESRLDTIADIFCYPNGQWNDFTEDTIAELKAAGYIAAVMGVDGFDNTKADTDMFRVKRFGIPYEPELFKQYICGLEFLKRRFLG